MSTGTTFLTHNRIQLAVHTLREGDGRPALLLHGLGEQSPDEVPVWLDGWDGPVHALDFTGHGASTLPRGGGYSAELLLADADIALSHLGEATVVGRGLGAYIALLLAGARPKAVRGAVLCDGPGLWGGPSVPTSNVFLRLPPVERTPDPYALFEMARDLRPKDYAALFVRLAVEHSGIGPDVAPITVAGTVRPPWLAGVVEEVGVAELPLGTALRLYARL